MQRDAESEGIGEDLKQIKQSVGQLLSPTNHHRAHLWDPMRAVPPTSCCVQRQATGRVDNDPRLLRVRIEVAGFSETAQDLLIVITALKELRQDRVVRLDVAGDRDLCE